MSHKARPGVPPIRVEDAQPLSQTVVLDWCAMTGLRVRFKLASSYTRWFYCQKCAMDYTHSLHSFGDIELEVATSLIAEIADSRLPVDHAPLCGVSVGGPVLYLVATSLVPRRN